MNSIHNLNLSELLKQVLKANPRGSEKEHRETMLAHVLTSKALQMELYDYWHQLRYHKYKVETPKEHETVIHVTRGRRRMLAERSARIVQNNQEIIYMDMMIDGKKLRNYTFGGIGKFGGVCAEIAKQGKPNELIGRGLREIDLRNLFMRNSPQKVVNQR